MLGREGDHRVCKVQIENCKRQIENLKSVTLAPESPLCVEFMSAHGLEGGFAHDYTRQELEPWAEHIRKQARSAKTVFAYFNNDANVRGPANARLLLEMI